MYIPMFPTNMFFLNKVFWVVKSAMPSACGVGVGGVSLFLFTCQLQRLWVILGACGFMYSEEGGWQFPLCVPRCIMSSSLMFPDVEETFVGSLHGPWLVAVV